MEASGKTSVRRSASRTLFMMRYVSYSVFNFGAHGESTTCHTVLADPYFGLLELEAARDQVRLVANPRQLVAGAAKTQCVDGAVIGLQIVDTAHHWLRGLDEFVRD